MKSVFFFKKIPKFSQNFTESVFFFFVFFFVFFVFFFFFGLFAFSSFLLFSGSLTFSTKRFLRMRFVK